MLFTLYWAMFCCYLLFFAFCPLLDIFLLKGVLYLEFRVKHVDVEYIREIEKKAKLISERTGRRFTRNDYMLQLIRNDSESELIEYRKSEFDLLADELRLALAENTQRTNVLIDRYEMLFDFLVKHLD